MHSHTIFRSKWLAVAWFVFISILFFLPGSALPNESWLKQIYFDKWVHTGFFALLIFLWGSAFNNGSRHFALFLFTAIALYAVLVEIIQKEWIPARSFDVYDIIADITGAVLGLWVWGRIGYKKNRPL